MATLEELSQALIKADAAGNADDARILAAEIQRMRSEQAAPAPAQAPTPEPQQPAPLPSAASEEAMIGQPETTLGGLAASAARGAGPAALGAAAGALMGGVPTGGIGAVPGAALGAGTMVLADPIVAGINALFGTHYTQPSDAVRHYLTQLGVPKPDTSAERIVEAASRGVGEAAGGVGIGRTMMQAARPTVRAIGASMAEQPVQQIASGVGAEVASQAAKEAGYGPAGQLLAGLGGGIGAGISPGSFTRQATQKPIGATVSAAVKGDKAALQSLAEAGAADPAVRKAASDLGLNVEEIPDYLLSKNPQFQSVAASVASVPQSVLKLETDQALQSLKTRADGIIEQLGGTTDLSQLSSKVESTTKSMRDELRSKVDKIYNEDLKALIPEKTPTKADNAIAFAKDRLDKFNGDVSQLNRLDKLVLGLQSGARSLSKDEIGVIDDQIRTLNAQRAAGDRTPELANRISELEASKGQKVSSPTTFYTVDELRKKVGEKTRNPNSPLFADADAGLAKAYYGLLSKDIDAAASAVGADVLIAEKNDLVKKQKALEDGYVSLFGKEGQKSMGKALQDATRGLANKAAYTEYAKLLSNVPKELRQEVAVSSLVSAFGRDMVAENFTPSTFVKWYDGLMSNQQSKNALFSNVPPQTKQFLDNLYKYSSNIKDALAEKIPTGRLTTSLQAPTTALQNVLTAVKKAGIAAGVATTLEPVTGSTLSAAIAGSIAASASKDTAPILKAADDLLVSPQFRDLVKAAKANPDAFTRAAENTVQSSAFKKFADAVNLPAAQRNALFLTTRLEEPQPLATEE